MGEQAKDIVSPNGLVIVHARGTSVIEQDRGI
jgi:hypothetical protein